jgi:CheY-like chemotaxis protein
MVDIKKRLFNIPELNIASRLGGMEGQQLEQYVSKLNEFVDSFPENEKKLRDYLEKKALDSVIDIVRGFGNSLTEIFADNLADEVKKHVNDFKNLPFERVKAYVVYLLSILISLSIDIQMATLADENNRAATSQPSSANAAANAVKLILTVDDDSFCLDTLKNTMNGVPCNIMAATNGSTALNILRTHTPDLFVLDIEMPGMNGLELAEKLRSLGYNAPIIFITGNADKNYVIKAIHSGGSDFIAKPFNPQNVVTRIKKFL